MVQSRVLPEDKRTVTLGGPVASTSAGYTVVNQFMDCPSVPNQSGATGTIYLLVSPVNYRKMANSSRIELVHSREPKLANISFAVQCHVFSFNLLPETNGLQGTDPARYIPFDLSYYLNPNWIKNPSMTRCAGLNL